MSVVGSFVVFAVLVLLGRVCNENRFLLILRVGKDWEDAAQKLIEEHFAGKALLRAKNTTREASEFIFELSRSAYDAGTKKSGQINARLYELEGVEYVNVVAQSDEITG